MAEVKAAYPLCKFMNMEGPHLMLDKREEDQLLRILNAKKILNPAGEMPPLPSLDDSDLARRVEIIKHDSNLETGPCTETSDMVSKSLTVPELYSLHNPRLLENPDGKTILKGLVHRVVTFYSKNCRIQAGRNFNDLKQNIKTLTEEGTDPDQAKSIRSKLEKTLKLGEEENIRDDKVKCKLIQNECVRTMCSDTKVMSEIFKELEPILRSTLGLPEDKKIVTPAKALNADDADLSPLIKKMFTHISEGEDSVNKAWRLAEIFLERFSKGNRGDMLNAINRTIDSL